MSPQRVISRANPSACLAYQALAQLSPPCGVCTDAYTSDLDCPESTRGHMCARAFCVGRDELGPVYPRTVQPLLPSHPLRPSPSELDRRLRLTALSLATAALDSTPEADADADADDWALTPTTARAATIEKSFMLTGPRRGGKRRAWGRIGRARVDERVGISTVECTSVGGRRLSEVVGPEGKAKAGRGSKRRRLAWLRGGQQPARPRPPCFPPTPLSCPRDRPPKRPCPSRQQA